MKERPEPQEWFFFKAGSDAGLKAGPFSWERLLVQAQRGSLEPNDVVWDPNSGWKTAVEVPGLFPDLPSTPVVESTFPDAPAPESPARRKKGSRWYWIGALVAAVIIGGALGLYFGLAAGGDDDGTDGTIAVTTTVATSASTSTSAAGTGGSSTSTSTPASTSTSQSTGTTVTVTTDATEYAARLDRGDSGNEVKLHVGDRVRVDLEPWVGDRITYVFWEFRPSPPVVVRVTDSGSEVIDGVVVSAWLEFEAVVPGPATVRAKYEYPNGTTEAKFVAYVIVSE